MRNWYPYWQASWQHFVDWKQQHPRQFYGGMALGALLVLFWIGFGTLVYLTNRGHFGPAPDQDALLAFRNDVGSEAFDRQGKSLGRFYAQDRTVCRYADLPEHLVHALIVTEDSRFYEHRGIDWHAYGRVVWKTLLRGQEDQGGGSTLSQQIIKNAYGRPELGYLPKIDLALHKLREALVARRLERVLTKEQIIERYLNTVSFPGNTYGIAAAARNYFQKEPTQLTVRESAALIASLKGNTRYDPRRSPERNTVRADRTLGLMAAAGYLSTAAHEQALKDPLCVNYYRESHLAGLAPHFTVAVRQRAEAILKELGYNLYTDNLRVYTTLDTRYQAHAEAALYTALSAHQRDFERHLGGRPPWETDASLRSAVRTSARWRQGRQRGLDTLELQKIFETPVEMELPVPNGEALVGNYSPLDSVAHALKYLLAGFLVLDPADGAIRSWVGGPDFNFDQYDHVLSRHQTGSTFKPFLYAAALRDGYGPCSTFSNYLRTYGAGDDSWTPQNADHEYGGRYSLHGALSHSINTIAVELINRVGPEKVVDLAHEVGLQGDMPPVLSIALGTLESSLLEMVGGYATFANGGSYAEPYYIARIETADGRVVYRHESRPRRVLTAEQAATMLTLLRYVVERGTANRLRWEHGVMRPSAGKTGTTQKMADGWYVGMTPALTGGAWVGGLNTGIRFRSGNGGNGSRSALPIWAEFIKRLEEDPQLGDAALGVDFPPLDDRVKAQFYCAEYIPSEEELLEAQLDSLEAAREPKTPLGAVGAEPIGG